MDDDTNQNPPPLPNRPGRPVRIQSIDALKPENKHNDYVDTNTIAATINPPKRPPKVHTLKKPSQAVEQQDNATNEHREQLKVCKQKSQEEYKSPQLPPRNNRAPALPPRAVTNFPTTNGLSRPSSNVPSKPSSLVDKSLQCNSTTERHQVNPVRTNTASNRCNSNRLQSSVLIITSEPPRLASNFPTLRRQDKPPTKDPPLVTQPQTANNITLTLDQTGALNNTIICPRCGRCRCSHCTGERQLPERWLCEGNCRCSADSVVDTLSCMCFVKCCFKSCIDNPDGQRVDPCSCTDTPKCLVRWSAMAALSLCLPCLCCYWPMQLGVKAATACYNSPCCRNRGCNCEDWEITPVKQLLTADLIRNLHCHVYILSGTRTILR